MPPWFEFKKTTVTPIACEAIPTEEHCLEKGPTGNCVLCDFYTTVNGYSLNLDNNKCVLNTDDNKKC